MNTSRLRCWILPAVAAAGEVWCRAATAVHFLPKLFIRWLANVKLKAIPRKLGHWRTALSPYTSTTTPAQSLTDVNFDFGLSPGNFGPCVRCYPYGAADCEKWLASLAGYGRVLVAFLRCCEVNMPYRCITVHHLYTFYSLLEEKKIKARHLRLLSFFTITRLRRAQVSTGIPKGSFSYSFPRWRPSLMLPQDLLFCKQWLAWECCFLFFVASVCVY